MNFNQKALALLLLHDALHRVVYEVVGAHSVHELLDLEIVLVDRLEEHVEPLEDVQVRLFELLVNLDQVNACLYFLIALILKVAIGQVLHVEQDLLVLPLLVLLQAQGVLPQLRLELLLRLVAVDDWLADLLLLLVLLGGLLVLRRALYLLDLLLGCHI